MSLDLDDTIVALASPAGSALRGIVRVSGDNIAETIDRLFRPDEQSWLWRHSRLPRRFTGHLNLASIIVPVPVALMYWPTRRSYTGQPMAEFHLNGSMPLLEATLDHLCETGARLARRGEFTMRAFLSGRIDLLQAEAVLGVIEAADHNELQKALSQLGGRMTSRLRQLRVDLIALLGDLEAGLDFVDEDIEFITKSEINRRLDDALMLVNELFAVSTSRLPTGYRRRIVLAGLPNAGKSTLFNRLTGRENAIVSPIAGTTRDYLTATIKIGVLEVELIDTAGWEDASSLIEQRAQQLRTEQVAASDLVVWCTAADLAASDRVTDDALIREASRQCPAIIRVETRCDVVADAVGTEMRLQRGIPLRVSGTIGTGLDSLRSDILQQLTATEFGRSELLSTTAVRCRDSLRQTIQSLEQARSVSREVGGDELIALEIRRALLELGTMLGEVYTDDILDHIFSNFCIGK